MIQISLLSSKKSMNAWTQNLNFVFSWLVIVSYNHLLITTHLRMSYVDFDFFLVKKESVGLL